MAWLSLFCGVYQQGEREEAIASIRFSQYGTWPRTRLPLRDRPLSDPRAWLASSLHGSGGMSDSPWPGDAAGEFLRWVPGATYECCSVAASARSGEQGRARDRSTEPFAPFPWGFLVSYRHPQRKAAKGKRCLIRKGQTVSSRNNLTHNSE